MTWNRFSILWMNGLLNLGRKILIFIIILLKWILPNQQKQDGFHDNVAEILFCYISFNVTSFLFLYSLKPYSLIRRYEAFDCLYTFVSGWNFQKNYIFKSLIANCSFRDQMTVYRFTPKSKNIVQFHDETKNCFF